LSLACTTPEDRERRNSERSEQAEGDESAPNAGEAQEEEIGAQAAAKIRALQERMQKNRPAENAIPAPDDVSAPPEGAERSESGLAWRVLEAGTGEDRPSVHDEVRVHYTGWRAEDGEMFDSSVSRGRAASFPLGRVIPGWTEGLQLMVVGEKRRFWIPANLAYEGRPGPQGVLVFDVELLEIIDRPEPPPTPEDISAPPANARRTDSGLAYRVIERGNGRAHPDPWDEVTVNYSGWRAEDGEMFDSSVTRGEPASFTLNRVIPGWTEGLQLMVVGEKARFWIPANLAYEGRRGPQGMLVFDVELISIQDRPAPPQAPSDVSAVPANAERAESGLASRVLEAGTGTTHPTATSRVRVHYSGWRAEDGEMFDSSRQRGEPVDFPLNGVIPGWTEGLQLMVAGEQRRFWIPGNLAYDGRRGPQGMLVFDVELIEILETPSAPTPPSAPGQP
jgi:peptidylprolyl isomerase